MTPSPTQARGYQAESDAESFLTAQGYTILERNFRAGRYGEIDLVAQDGDTLVFVEVRSRTTPTGSTPAESVTELKLGRLLRAAEYYLVRRRLDCFWRVDVVAVFLDPDGKPRRQTLYRNVTMDG
jgi:putative endonuclease